MAHFGARMLDTDYLLSGDRAAGAAGHAMASAILASGLDDLIDPILQEKARAILGGLETIPELLRHREQAHRRSSQGNG
jgi:hypothetical protein